MIELLSILYKWRKSSGIPYYWAMKIGQNFDKQRKGTFMTEYEQDRVEGKIHCIYNIEDFRYVRGCAVIY